MALEIAIGRGEYQYRLPAKSRIIQRRLNKHRARWIPWRMYDNHEQAKAALLALKKDIDE